MFINRLNLSIVGQFMQLAHQQYFVMKPIHYIHTQYHSEIPKVFSNYRKENAIITVAEEM